MKYQRLNGNDQQGFVSIIVSMVIITVITLITIGYATAMAREQRQSLNRQLNTQAYYAAESGVNETMADVSLLLKQSGLIPTQLNCQDVASTLVIRDNYGSDTGVSVPCVIINPNPLNIFFQNQTTNNFKAKYFKIIASPNIDSIRISWSAANGAATTGSHLGSPSYPFPTLASWPTNVGAINMMLVPFVANDSRDAIIAKTAHFKFIPTSTGSASSVSYAATANGATYTGTPGLTGANCSKVSSFATPPPQLDCSVAITGVPTSGELNFVISSLYRPNDIIIEAFDSFGNVQPVSGVQVAIDVTAKSTDILRRINVRLPIQNDVTRPFPTFEASADICKLIAYNSFYNINGCGP